MEETTKNPGEVIKESLSLTSMYGKTEKIENYVLEIHLYEDIYSPFLSGECVIDDATNFIEKFPVVGAEKLTMSFRTPTFDDEPTQIISKTFFVYGIKERILNNDRQQTYKLKFTSQEHINNNATTISKPFFGTTHEIAASIFEDYIQKDSREQDVYRFAESTEKTPMLITDTPHKTKIQYISNGWTPANNLSYLTRKSEGSSLTGSDFLFYESNKQFFFTSVQFLVKQGKQNFFEEYVYNPPGMDIAGRGGGDSFYGKVLPPKWNQITNITIPSTIDIVRSQNNGQYANVTRGYDIVTKEYREAYIDTLEDFTKFETTDDGNPVPQGTPRNSFTMSTSKVLNSANYDDYSMNIENALFNEGTRISYLLGLAATKFEIEVPGRTDIEVGSMIKFLYPAAQERGSIPTGQELFDKVLSGAYLISAIRHKMTRGLGGTWEHVMTLEIVKNGLGRSLGSED